MNNKYFYSTHFPILGCECFLIIGVEKCMNYKKRCICLKTDNEKLVRKNEQLEQELKEAHRKIKIFEQSQDKFQELERQYYESIKKFKIIDKKYREAINAAYKTKNHYSKEMKKMISILRITD